MHQPAEEDAMDPEITTAMFRDWLRLIERSPAYVDGQHWAVQAVIDLRAALHRHALWVATPSDAARRWPAR